MKCLKNIKIGIIKNKMNRIKLLLAIAVVCTVSACELIPSKAAPTRIPTYGDYYLWLKTLDNAELLQEIEQQNKNKEVKSPDADIYVMLLHSLPKSPIYNPYTAKSMLNELRLQYVESRYNPTNLALITLLKDLLNEQLLMINKHDNLALDLKNSRNILLSTQDILGKKNKDLLTNEQQILELQQQVELLKEQINQLHRIEKNINEHGS